MVQPIVVPRVLRQGGAAECWQQCGVLRVWGEQDNAPGALPGCPAPGQSTCASSHTPPPVSPPATQSPPTFTASSKMYRLLRPAGSLHTHTSTSAHNHTGLLNWGGACHSQQCWLQLAGPSLVMAGPIALQLTAFQRLHDHASTHCHTDTHRYTFPRHTATPTPTARGLT